MRSNVSHLQNETQAFFPQIYGLVDVRRVEDQGRVVEGEGGQHLVLAQTFQSVHPEAICGLEKLKGGREVDPKGCGTMERTGKEGGKEGMRTKKAGEDTIEGLDSRLTSATPLPPSPPPSFPPSFLSPTVRVEKFEQGDEDREADVREDNLPLVRLFHAPREASGWGREGIWREEREEKGKRKEGRDGRWKGAGKGRVKAKR
jgi:hypothetical protein